MYLIGFEEIALAEGEVHVDLGNDIVFWVLLATNLLAQLNLVLLHHFDGIINLIISQ